MDTDINVVKNLVMLTFSSCQLLSFGFLLLSYVILTITCAEVTIVLCYFQLCSEDYRWWWKSLITSGSTGLYVFIYACVYFYRLESSMTVTYFLYFGYMSIISLAVFLVTGNFPFPFSSIYLSFKLSYSY